MQPLTTAQCARKHVELPLGHMIEVRLVVGEATFSVDGERDHDLQAGETVRVALSPHRARFLRLGEPTKFYGRLAHRLNWLGEPTRGESSDS